MTDEKMFDKIREQNKGLLAEFRAWMKAQHLSIRTIDMHSSNAHFYIQEFLLYEQPLRPAQGVSDIGMYLGYWFIRKGPIATPGTIKTSATSIVKFYTFLLEKGQISAEQLGQMRQTIRSEMSHWQERARRYNNPNITDQSKIWI